ncbi:MAG TPA: HAEPLYID family protein [Adhaeribacter sp.]|nr:HAEPLYID family protein [Adhaeribacter sp.]
MKTHIIKFIVLLITLLVTIPLATALAQHFPADSTSRQLPLKLNHAEPLYIDLIRDLGARKGEKEWNFGMGLTDHLDFDKYEMLVEYEWAPVDRLGLEIEVPVSIYSPNISDRRNSRPSDRIEGLKTAAQYTFLVNEKHQTSMALGYINELEFYNLNELSVSKMLMGNKYNPFLVVAKRLTPKLHSLIYTGPQISQHFKTGHWESSFDINSNLHYMLPESRNFIGVELNKSFQAGNFDMVVRPQMRVSLMDNLIVGLVAGVPVTRYNERMSCFFRLIYEPGHSH